ncbi:MAG: hypothetical protein EPN75_03230 [Beijerinckiaceae bacterium]|nr:MAG: hypothetical protein EPN75_03230 [Beijerinckiaceae bacterium]
MQNQTNVKKYGMAIIANDRVFDWLLPFLESYKATNAATPLYIIPYDDNMARTRKAAEVYGAEVVDLDNGQLDALARRLYPLNPGHRRRLRKLLALALPLDEVIYFDADIILLRDFSPLFGMIEAGKREFIVAAKCNDYVYNAKHAQYDYLRGAMLFNDGFFATSRDVLSLQNFFDVIEADEKVFHTVRQRGGLFAQPLTNFVVHRRGLKLATLPDCIAGASGESYYKAEGVTFTDDGPLDQFGKRIYFCHWPGIIGMPGRRAFDGLWHEFAHQAAARMKEFA